MDKKVTILYVDDEEINLQLFEINFRKKFSVITAISGKRGLEQLRNRPEIDVIISDMKMPEMNGIEFIRKAKLINKNAICYILTGFEITDEIEAALESQLIHRYFSKPFKRDDIEGSIYEMRN
jgi:two-component system response regulator (stage 0 sporulation protein F)